MFDAVICVIQQRNHSYFRFRYLLTSRLLVPDDFPAITASHQTLAERFAHGFSMISFVTFRPVKP